jgi:hypothetical protein
MIGQYPTAVELARMPYAEYAQRLRPLLRMPVSELPRTPAPTPAPNDVTFTPPEQTAFRAAWLMRQQGNSWLVIRDAQGGFDGYVHADDLAPVLDFVDIAPFLGETAVSDLLQPAE